MVELRHKTKPGIDRARGILRSKFGEFEVIKEVDELLWQWGAWIDQRESNSLGYKMSVLNECMAMASNEHQERRVSRPVIDGEKMLLVDAVLCRKVKPDTKRLIDRYYRGAVGGLVAIQSDRMPKRRAGAHTQVFADMNSVTRQTVHAWIHNAHVELQLAMATVVHRVKQVGVAGVVMEIGATCANDA
ncbi:hypothetical protein [Chromobacterium vaccinii]|uniref:hypothetical protein n=1 Tax=Chromobacterium vaccinii TaxID=1108595 RepID=UPI000617F4F9|nr:hypothetical protein [Chromobacterium vaccinii]